MDNNLLSSIKIKVLSQLNKIELNNNEIIIYNHIINNINFNNYKSVSTNKLSDVIAHIISEKILSSRHKIYSNESFIPNSKKNNINKNSDIKEMDNHTRLKSVIGNVAENTSSKYISSFIQTDNKNSDLNEDVNVDIDTNINSLFNNISLNKLCYKYNPSSLYIHQYVVLDSNYRDVSQDKSNTVSKFVWNYSANNNIVNGSFFSNIELTNIVGINLYQPIIPYLASMDTDAKRVSILIEELSAQSFISSNGRHSHFILRPSYTTATTSVELNTEDNYDHTLWFNEPFIKLDKMTITFGNPDTVLSFTVGAFDRFIIEMEFILLKQ